MQFGQDSPFETEATGMGAQNQLDGDHAKAELASLSRQLSDLVRIAIEEKNPYIEMKLAEQIEDIQSIMRAIKIEMGLPYYLD
jgi:hypothetical protein